MGLFDFFTGGKEGQLKRHARRLKNLNAQAEDRQVSAHWLAEEGSEEEKAYLLKQAKAEKAFAIFSIAINTAIAVVKALPNVIKAITIGALGAASAIAVAAKPLPQFAQGGIVTPTPGGTDVNVAEAGQTEVIFPLDKLGEFLGDMPGLGGAEEGSIHLTVQMDSKPILEKIFPATRNREVIIDARAVI